jgi:hydroxymethylglutaryl-CoA lyase
MGGMAMTGEAARKGGGTGTVEVIEVGPRDGFQIEPQIIPTADKIRFINRLAACGFPAMEVVAFVGARAVPQMADAAEVLAGLDRSRGTVFRGLVPNARGAERAAAAGVGEMVAFLSASETHNRANLNRSVEESLRNVEDVVGIARSAGIGVHGGIATSFGCPFEGDIAPDRVSSIAQAFHAMGIRGLTLGDTTGMATPPLVSALCRKLRADLPDMKVTLHFHNTRGLGLVNVMAGLDAGITSFESTVGGLGGCPFAPRATGNISTEDLVNLLDEIDRPSGIDLQSLIGVARDVETLLGRTLPGQVMRAGSRLTLHRPDSVQIARA